MKEILATIHRFAAQPFEWGRRDCALLPADWFLHVHGIDPAAHLREAYHDLASCHRATGWFTDPVGVVEGCLQTVRQEPGAYPRDPATLSVGDVGVLAIPLGRRAFPAGGVWLGHAWAFRAEAGVTTRHPATLSVLATWGIGYAA